MQRQQHTVVDDVLKHRKRRLLDLSVSSVASFLSSSDRLRDQRKEQRGRRRDEAEQRAERQRVNDERTAVGLVVIVTVSRRVPVPAMVTAVTMAAITAVVTPMAASVTSATLTVTSGRVVLSLRRQSNWIVIVVVFNRQRICVIFTCVTLQRASSFGQISRLFRIQKGGNCVAG